MMAACTSEVDVEGNVHELRADLELKHGPVKLNDACADMHLMVTRSMHIAFTVSPDKADLKMKSLLSCGRLLTFWLLDQNLEYALLGWHELDHIIRVMVGHEDIGDVEVALCKLLVIRDEVQVVREVSVRALLLEWIVPRIAEMVVLVIELLSTALLPAMIVRRIHQIGVILASAVRVLKGRINALLAELAPVAALTGARISATVELAEVIAHKVVRILKWLTNSMLRGLPAEHANTLLCRLEALNTRLTLGTSIWRCTDAGAILTLFSPGIWIAHLGFLFI